MCNCRKSGRRKTGTKSKLIRGKQSPKALLPSTERIKMPEQDNNEILQKNQDIPS
jgi:hypothetical protein